MLQPEARPKLSANCTVCKSFPPQPKPLGVRAHGATLLGGVGGESKDVTALVCCGGDAACVPLSSMFQPKVRVNG